MKQNKKIYIHCKTCDEILLHSTICCHGNKYKIYKHKLWSSFIYSVIYLYDLIIHIS